MAGRCSACGGDGQGQICTRCDEYGRLEKCGSGYPSAGLPCIRVKGHQSPVSDCFAVKDGHGVYMQQDGKDWVGPDRTRWPDDELYTRDEPKSPLYLLTQEEFETDIIPDRRAAIAATKAKNAKEPQ